MNEIPKVVFSRRGASILNTARADTSLPGAESWANAYVASGDLAEEVAKTESAGGKRIIAKGGVALVRSLLTQGLVDQIELAIAPVALGEGLSLFSDLAAPLQLKLVSATLFPGGVTAQIYRIA